MSKVVGSGLRTRVRWTSDLSETITAAPTSLTGSPVCSSWLPTAPMTIAISIGSIPRRQRIRLASRAPVCSWLTPPTTFPMSGRDPAIAARWIDRSGRASRRRTLPPMLATRFACRAPCSVYPIAPVYSSAFAIYASTSGSRLMSSRVKGRPVRLGVTWLAALRVSAMVGGEAGLSSRGPPLRERLDRRAVRPDADVLGEFERQVVVLDVQNDAVQTSAGQHPVSLLEARQHLPIFFLLHLLRPDQHDIEHREKDEQRQQRRDLLDLLRGHPYASDRFRVPDGSATSGRFPPGRSSAPCSGASPAASYAARTARLR